MGPLSPPLPNQCQNVTKRPYLLLLQLSPVEIWCEFGQLFLLMWSVRTRTIGLQDMEESKGQQGVQGYSTVDIVPGLGKVTYLSCGSHNLSLLSGTRSSLFFVSHTFREKSFQWHLYSDHDLVKWITIFVILSTLFQWVPSDQLLHQYTDVLLKTSAFRARST